MASKVYHYRKDLISESQLSELEKNTLEVEAMRTSKATEPKTFEAAMEKLDKLLCETGGKIYPKTFWSDNLEVLLVAAIIVIGVRTFFFQPFIIPTNSMYPTYNGMTYKLYADDDKSPDGFARRLFNKIQLGAKHKRLTANNEGTLLIPLAGKNQKGNLVFWRKQVDEGRKWMFLPTVLNECTFYVGDVVYTLRVPGDFDIDSLLQEAFGSNEVKIVPSSESPTGFALDTGRYLEVGDPILRFDINLGDALFVDRISYHFRKPKVGDPIVFRTREISKELGDKYYIKRLAGTGGETLEIRDGALLVDGEPRDEVEAFVLNAEKTGEYEGYVNTGFLDKGLKWTIPENSFVALGDNSDNSRDSRSWGFVPEKTVIGKAIFIYYPFTSHWGVAE